MIKCSREREKLRRMSLPQKDRKTYTRSENGRKGERKIERLRVPEGVRKRDNLH